MLKINILNKPWMEGKKEKMRKLNNHYDPNINIKQKKRIMLPVCVWKLSVYVSIYKTRRKSRLDDYSTVQVQWGIDSAVFLVMWPRRSTGRTWDLRRGRTSPERSQSQGRRCAQLGQWGSWLYWAGREWHHIARDCSLCSGGLAAAGFQSSQRTRDLVQARGRQSRWSCHFLFSFCIRLKVTVRFTSKWKWKMWMLKCMD